MSIKQSNQVVFEQLKKMKGTAKNKVYYNWFIYLTVNDSASLKINMNSIFTFLPIFNQNKTSSRITEKTVWWDTY